jgi:hypothetical protein
MRWSEAVAELGRSAANRMAKGNHELIFRQVSRPDCGLLVPPSDGNQHLMCCQASDDRRGRLDIGNCRHGENNRIRLVPFYRYQPVAQRKVRSQVKYRHPSPPGRRGVRQNPELVMTAGGQPGQQEREALAIHRGRVERGTQASLYRRRY